MKGKILGRHIRCDRKLSRISYLAHSPRDRNSTQRQQRSDFRAPAPLKFRLPTRPARKAPNAGRENACLVTRRHSRAGNRSKHVGREFAGAQLRLGWRSVGSYGRKPLKLDGKGRSRTPIVMNCEAIRPAWHRTQPWPPSFRPDGRLPSVFVGRIRSLDGDEPGCGNSNRRGLVPPGLGFAPHPCPSPGLASVPIAFDRAARRFQDVAVHPANSCRAVRDRVG